MAVDLTRLAAAVETARADHARAFMALQKAVPTLAQRRSAMSRIAAYERFERADVLCDAAVARVQAAIRAYEAGRRRIERERIQAARSAEAARQGVLL